MKGISACLLCICMAFLCGCAGPLGTQRNVEELLRAPQATGVQSAVQSALKGYIGDTVQLKYPRGGNEMSPIVFADLNCDGKDEAVVTFLNDDSRNVRLALLTQTETGWSVVNEVEGLSTEITSMELVSLTGQGVQLVVGYGNATLSDKYLVIYACQPEGLTRLYGQAYSDYLTADFAKKDLSQLVLVTPSVDGALSLVLLGGQDGVLEQKQTLSLDERFATCKALYATRSGGNTGLIFEGTFSSGGTANQVLRYNGDRFINWPGVEGRDVPLETLRFQSALVPTDFRGTGALELPVTVVTAGTLSSARRFYYVTWFDYLGTSTTERFGVYDATYGYFVRLPLEWRGQINITEGSQSDTWQVRMIQENVLMATFRVQERATTVGAYTLGATLDNGLLYYYLSENCTSYEVGVIRNGMTVLDH